MNGADDAQAWGAIRAGLRPSTVLTVGAALTLAGPLAQVWLGDHTVAWTLWGASLVTVGVGLILGGLRPWLGPLGLVAGGLFLAQAVALGIALLDVAAAGLTYRLVALPKLLVLVLIALVCWRALNVHRRVLLAVAGLAGAGKVAARCLDLVPAACDTYLDPCVNALLALALLLVARGLRHRENEWAHRTHLLSTASFDDFNRR